MKKEIKTKWMGNMAFESTVDGHKIIMDAEDKFGGEDRGPRPKPLLMAALTGCTGMDIASLLKKMRVKVDDFEIEAIGEQTEEHPKHYSSIHLIYTFKGHNLDKAKIEKAVDLSQERYCGVSHMLRKASSLTHEIVYEVSEELAEA